MRTRSCTIPASSQRRPFANLSSSSSVVSGWDASVPIAGRMAKAANPIV